MNLILHNQNCQVPRDINIWIFTFHEIHLHLVMSIQAAKVLFRFSKYSCWSCWVLPSHTIWSHYFCGHGRLMTHGGEISCIFYSAIPSLLQSTRFTCSKTWASAHVERQQQQQLVGREKTKEKYNGFIKQMLCAMLKCCINVISFQNYSC